MTENAPLTPDPSAVPDSTPQSIIEPNLPIAPETREKRRCSCCWLECAIGAVIVFVGIAIRLRVFLVKRSLGRDEAALALNIVHRTFGGLFKPLDNNQGAPVGFLVVEKIFVKLLGNHETSLRLFPLLMSIFAVVLFWWFCRSILSASGTLVALVVMALGAKMYVYSADTKQYTTDVFVAAGLMLLAVRTLGDPTRGVRPTLRGLIALAIGGAVSVWFSHPALFVLGGIGAMGIIQWFSARKALDLLGLIGVAAVWLLSFGALFKFILKPLAKDGFMQWFWAKADAFAPIPKSLGAIIWYKKNFFEIFHDPASLDFVGLAALLFILGIVGLYRTRKGPATLVLLPILLALVASMFHKYPFRERLILFIVPMLACFIGAGIEYLLQGDRRLVGVISILFLLITPLNTSLEFAKKPPGQNDIRASMKFAAAHHEPGDLFYIYPFCEYGFQYYKDQVGLSDAPMTLSSRDVADRNVYKDEVKQLIGKRVWVMFEDTADHAGINEQQMALAEIEAIGGKKLFESSPLGEYVACYDLRSNPAPTTNP